MDIEWLDEFETLSVVGKRDLMTLGLEGRGFLRYLRDKDDKEMTYDGDSYDNDGTT